MDIEVKLEVPPTLPKWGVSDNASSNMVKALNQSILELYRCLNHTQQLGIGDTFKAIKSGEYTMEDIAEMCRKLSAHLHRADNSRKLLADECEVTDHYPKCIPTANDTR